MLKVDFEYDSPVPYEGKKTISLFFKKDEFGFTFGDKVQLGVVDLK